MSNPYESIQPATNPTIENSSLRRHWIFLGAVLAAAGVGLGAFGAHGLEGLLADRHSGDPELLNRRMGNWSTAALYQMHHAIGLILVGVVSLFRSSKWLTAAGWCFLVGILVFSGMLYALVLTELRFLGAIVPIGGVAFIVGWASLAVGGCCLSPNAPVQLNQTH